MKQLGNLAVVCAQRPDVLMQIWSVIIKVKSPNARKGDKIITLRRDSKWENGIQARNAGRR